MSSDCERPQGRGGSEGVAKLVAAVVCVFNVVEALECCGVTELKNGFVCNDRQHAEAM